MIIVARTGTLVATIFLNKLGSSRNEGGGGEGWLPIGDSPSILDTILLPRWWSGRRGHNSTSISICFNKKFIQIKTNILWQSVYVFFTRY